ncbi:hypothetical protein CaCOL14_013063 [Colletotrichum acutatum]|uniref:Uncharacterized protein n=1 Tax=Glomerella acutata TaxID=27357 RepID=A0AAD9D1V9_GLOAC|nr:uncharacterized protein BDZ83DRAFT_788323 [Colletotrichum acutatum]KAK1730031.1 hypothetical protein BDZ83DRAFT_788323 [Colletotrichum acutatum]
MSTRIFQRPSAVDYILGPTPIPTYPIKPTDRRVSEPSKGVRAVRVPHLVRRDVSDYLSQAFNLVRHLDNSEWGSLLGHAVLSQNPVRYIVTEHDSVSAAEVHILDTADRILHFALEHGLLPGPPRNQTNNTPMIQSWGEATLSVEFNGNPDERHQLRADRIYCRTLKTPTDPTPIPNLNRIGDRVARSRCFMVWEVKAHHALDKNSLYTSAKDVKNTLVNFVHYKKKRGQDKDIDDGRLPQTPPPNPDDQSNRPHGWNTEDWYLILQAAAYACLYRTKYVAIFCWGTLYLLHFKNLSLSPGVTVEEVWKKGPGANCDITVVTDTSLMVAAVVGFAIEAYNNTPRDDIDGP